MGNATPLNVDHSDPVIYTWSLPGMPGDDGSYTHVAEGRPNGKDALVHVLTRLPHLPDHECFVSIVTDWPNHSPNSPTWVESDVPDLAVMLSEAYGCPVGAPEDLEATHHTLAGPPGVGPAMEE